MVKPNQEAKRRREEEERRGKMEIGAGQGKGGRLKVDVLDSLQRLSILDRTIVIRLLHALANDAQCTDTLNKGVVESSYGVVFPITTHYRLDLPSHCCLVDALCC